MEKGVSHSRWDVARIAVGAFVLASLQPGWVKFWNLYGHSAPHPGSGSRLAEASSVQLVDRSPIGTALGILYSVTTISGPPLAICVNNQGLVKNEFRAGLALVRVVESSVTAVVYYQLGLFIAESGNILLVFVPCVVVGIPLGGLFHPTVDARDVSSNMHEL